MSKKKKAVSRRPIVIGIPRAMLYHRYSVLWDSFFSGLGIGTVVSEPTTKGILEEGTSYAIDEACLATKIFLGHVKSLIGKCDYILIPVSYTHLLKENEEKLHELAEYLIEKETITGEEFMEILNLSLIHIFRR